MEGSKAVTTWAWRDVEKSWNIADEAKIKALDAISEASTSIALVGRMLLGHRNHCATQAEFEALLAANTRISPADAKRCISVHQRIALKQIDTADHASVRQLFLDVGLMPQPEPTQASPPQDAPWWIRITARIDGKLSRMDSASKEGLRRWCAATLQRLGG